MTDADTAHDAQTFPVEVFSPNLTRRLLLGIVAAVIGFGALYVVLSMHGSYSIHDQAMAGVFILVPTLLAALFFLNQNFARIEINSSEIIYRNIFGSKIFPLSSLNLVRLYHDKNGANLKVTGGKKFFILTWMSFSEISLKEIQSLILQNAAQKTGGAIATQPPPIDDKTFNAVMAFQVGIVVLIMAGILVLAVLHKL